MAPVPAPSSDRKAGGPDGRDRSPPRKPRTSTSSSLVARRRCGPSKAHAGAGRPPLPGRRLGGRQRDDVHPPCPDGRGGSGIGDPESRVSKRFKVMGILRDVLRQKSVGVIEELPEKGIVKYAKPVGLVASLVPTTNPELTPPGVACSPSSAGTRSSSRRIRGASARRMRPSRSCGARSPREGARPTCCNAWNDPASPRPIPDDAGGHRPGDRRAGHGQGRVQLGHACLRRRRRQLDDGHRRDGRHRRGGQATRGSARRPTSGRAARRTATSSSRDDLRRPARRPGGRGWPRRQPRGGEPARRPCGTRRAIGPRTPSRSPAGAGREGRIRSPTIAGSSSSSRPRSARTMSSARRS